MEALTVCVSYAEVGLPVLPSLTWTLLLCPVLVLLYHSAQSESEHFFVVVLVLSFYWWWWWWCCYGDKVSPRISGLPGFCYVDQSDLEVTEIYRPLPPEYRVKCYALNPLSIESKCVSEILSVLRWPTRSETFVLQRCPLLKPIEIHQYTQLT